MDQPLPQTTIIAPVVNTDVKKNSSTLFPKKIIFIVGIVLFLIVILGAVYFLLKPRPKPQEQIQPPTVPIQGATLILDANPIEATIGGQIKVSVLVKSDADSANLFIARLKFPSNIIQAKNIELRSEQTSSGFIKNWFISNWMENTIDNETGSVSLVGGVPNPGFKSEPESSGSAMADIIFTPKSSGEASISFDDTSTIYRNSDNANILTSKEGITVKILDEAPVAPTPATPAMPSGGDINQDGKVDLQDLSALLSVWGSLQGQSSQADLNNDSQVNVFDYSKLNQILTDLKIF